MELIHSNPYIRFADQLRFVTVRGPSKTYDCRLLYALKGAAELELEGQHYELTRGCLVIFQPGTHYCIRPQDRVTLAVMDFDFTQDYSERTDFLVPCPARDFKPELAHKQVDFSDAAMLSKPLFMENAGFLESTVRKLVVEFQNKQLLWQNICSSLFKQLLCEVVRSYEAGGDPQGLMSRLLPYIDQNIHRPISNAELGEVLGYNPNYLNRLILRHTGLSLHQYVLQRRLTLATGLLVTTQQPISEIALSLGFNSTAHFSGYFKKATGTTPAQCRKNGAL